MIIRIEINMTNMIIMTKKKIIKKYLIKLISRFLNMVELENENETTKLSSKINALNKNVKTLIFSIDKLVEKLNNTKPLEKTQKKRKKTLIKFLRKTDRKTSR